MLPRHRDVLIFRLVDPQQELGVSGLPFFLQPIEFLVDARVSPALSRAPEDTQLQPDILESLERDLGVANWVGRGRGAAIFGGGERNGMKGCYTSGTKSYSPIP
jgi:hypothetical protein